VYKYYLDDSCKEQDTEVCAGRIHLSSLNICNISICRSPMGNFLHTLDSILNFLHNNTIEIITCGDFNINCLNDIDPPPPKKQTRQLVIHIYSLSVRSLQIWKLTIIHKSVHCIVITQLIIEIQVRQARR